MYATTMDVQQKATFDNFMRTAPRPAKDVLEEARVEFNAHPDVFAKLGVNEFEFLRSRLIDGGMDAFDVADDTTAAGINAPGLVLTHPSGNEVGSRE